MNRAQLMLLIMVFLIAPIFPGLLLSIASGWDFLKAVSVFYVGIAIALLGIGITSLIGWIYKKLEK